MTIVWTVGKNEGGETMKRTVDNQISFVNVGCGVAVGLIILGLMLSTGCSGSTINAVTAPTTITGVRANTSTEAAPAQDAPPTPGQEVSADPVPATPENCGELDPQKWKGFSYSIERDAVTMRNSSTCDRMTTWRAFVVRSDSDQPPAGDAVLVVVPAGAGYGAPGSRLERPWVLTVHYSGGVAPCGVTIQVDGRAGNVPNMAHLNASFTAGRTFPTPACVVIVFPPTPPKTPPACIDPGFGPWVPVSPSIIPSRVTTHPSQVCDPMQRTRTLCSGLVQVEPRPADWCLTEQGQ